MVSVIVAAVPHPTLFSGDAVTLIHQVCLAACPGR